ncbi:MAG: 2-hydroxyglutaryl-CoA dehydratase [Desulfatitalea sp.]|nr:2-hydroxyglutaryl-CoA dehydratase [Desulfatitalea sp.]
MITVGIDIGSLSTKSAILGPDNEILAVDVRLTGGDNQKSAIRTFNASLELTQLTERDVDFVVTTGYGRENVPFSDKYVSEITCHAKGMHLVMPEVRTILDIGGQDSKAIHVDEEGSVVNFQMNDKCAAGSGRFLEVCARALGLSLDELGDVSKKAEKGATMSSMCTVFAESEVVSLVAVGTPVEEIVKGIHESIAKRAASLMKVVGIHGPIGMSGGVAKNSGMIEALEDILDAKIGVSNYPQVNGALGAALIGQRLALRKAS